MPDELNELLNGFLDGRLSPAQEARLRALLKRPTVARRLKRLEALRAGVRAALPRLQPEQSWRIWARVRARCVQERSVEAGAVERALLTAPAGSAESGAPGFWEAWFSRFSRPWVPAWGLGLGAAALALALAFLLYPRPARLPAGSAPLAPSVSEAAGPAPAAAHPLERSGAAVLALAGEAPRRLRRRSLAARARPAESLASALPRSSAPVQARASVAPVPILAGLPVQSPEALSPGATEVERALADNQANSLISQFLSEKPQEQAPVVAMLAPIPQASGQGAEDTVAYQTSAAPALQEESGSEVSGVARGGKDGDGYWNWTPAAQAMNQRDWPQARVELLAAAAKAGSIAERDFAHSALGLLAQSGGPLEGVQPILPSARDLRVLGAGTWQLLVDSRLARFGQGVAVRLPGLRESGDSFLLDLGFNRGEFSPGSHFIRVSGEAPIRVVDASGQPVSQDDFYAPSGADYDIQAKVLRLR